MYGLMGLCFLLGLTAYSDSNKEVNNASKEKNSPTPLNVNIVIPKDIQPNQKVKLTAEVTQGKEVVDDADQVEFEIWEKGQEDHEMVKGKHEGKGIYSVEHIFSKDGTYNVVSHVTARDLHKMPKKEIIIGQSEEEHHDYHAENGEHQHNQNLLIHFMTSDDKIKVKEEATLMAHIVQNELPFKEGKVRFEISSDMMKSHQFVEAKEAKDGEYTAKYSFEKPGRYEVKVHIEKDELHDHQVNEVNVK